MLYYPKIDKSAITDAINSGQSLISCLCASWCNNCEEWKNTFSELSNTQPNACFVWIDIDEHYDMVTEIELDTLPVLLIHHNNGLAFIGPIRPDKNTVLTLVKGARVNPAIFDPGVREFLIE